MVLFSIIGASLVCTGFVKSQPQYADGIFQNPDDLKGVLDWMHILSLHYEENKEVFNEYGEQIMEKSGILSRFDYGEILDHFIKDVHGLRRALVRGDCEDMVFSENARVFMLTLQSAIYIVRDCLDDLNSNITEWEKEAEGVSSDIKTTGPKQLLWFKEHGFHESKLNNITIEELKERIDSIYNHNKPMYRLLELFSTTFFLSKSHDSSSAYARVDTIAESPEAISLIKNYLKSDYNRVPPTIGTQIVDSLRELGKEGTPLRRYNERYQDAYMYAYYMKVMSTSVFTESSVSRYFDMVIGICLEVNIENMIYSLLLNECNVYRVGQAYQGGILNLDESSETDFKNKVDLFHGNWQLTMLCEAVTKYKYLVANIGYDTSTITNLRA